MSNQSLLQYLSIALPALPIQGAAPSRNTTNPKYDAGDITEVVDWPEFHYATIIERYGSILESKQIASDPFGSPPAAIRDEHHFLSRFGEYPVLGAHFELGLRSSHPGFSNSGLCLSLLTAEARQRTSTSFDQALPSSLLAAQTPTAPIELQET